MTQDRTQRHPIYCEDCKREIVDTIRDLHMTEDGRFEHRLCASGRAGMRYQGWALERRERTMPKAS